MNVNAILPLLLGLQNGNQTDLIKMLMNMSSQNAGTTGDDFFTQQNAADPIFPTGGTKTDKPIDPMMMMILTMMMQQNAKKPVKQDAPGDKKKTENDGFLQKTDLPNNSEKQTEQVKNGDDKKSDYFSTIEKISGTEVAESLKVLTENYLP